ncbi:uncharacterized protein N7484_008471 [Penicillium longicatenatum]|uniref:uncharacterized protein n=1 Tax=Penicillium longicatenatum TaxID=1561947 RepID=UPI0025469D3A|nr:uncharacterized protein N7484_008471 [Penicillium longicatenatum]KAJ5635158.1 hypothetical protein N7484_008471 [Penicillium longicatenatum]
MQVRRNYVRRKTQCHSIRQEEKTILQSLQKPAEKLPISQEPEADGGVKIEVVDIATESIERDEGPSGLLENTPISIEERAKEEQREGAAKEPPQASGSTGTSYIQRGKDATSGLAGFTTKASKLHAQLPGSIKKDAESRLQTGRQCITTTVQPAADGAKGKVEEITQNTSNIPTNLSSLSGLIVGDDGMILDYDGNYIGRLVEGETEDLAGQIVGEGGEILDEDGDMVGCVELLSGDLADESEAPADQDALGFKDLANSPLGEDGTIKDRYDRVLGKLVEGNVNDLVGWPVDENGEILDEDGNLVGRVELLASDNVGESPEQLSHSLLGPSLLKGKPINEEGKILYENGNLLGRIKGNQEAETMVGKFANEKGEIINNFGQIIGEVELVAGGVASKAMAEQQGAVRKAENDISMLDGLQVNEEGLITGTNSSVIGELDSGDLSEAVRMTVNEKGLELDDNGNIIGKARSGAKDAIEKTEKTTEDFVQGLPSLSTPEDLKCNRLGNIDNEDGMPVGERVEGGPKEVSGDGTELDGQAQLWDNRGKINGKAQSFSIDGEQNEGPFADLDEPFVTEGGWVHDANGNKVGQIVEGEIRKVLGRAVDDDGDILDKRGNLLGRAEPWQEPDIEPEDVDITELEGLTFHKIGNVIGPDGVSIARVSEGNPKLFAGRKINAQGLVWSDVGEVIGNVMLIPLKEREAMTLFGGIGDLVVRKTGYVEDETGCIVGKIVESDPQKLQGLLVDDDGDILDKRGNLKGRAEPYNLPEEEEEEMEEDISVLEGMKVNKFRNVVDQNGSVDDGNFLGSVGLIPSSEREQGGGIFYGLEGLVVTKGGTITDLISYIVGRLVEGDMLRLNGRAVDEDGEIIDKVGNVIGRAERWIAEETPRNGYPMSDRKINQEGEVRKGDGNLISQLMDGNLNSLSGKAVEENGYIVDKDGDRIGECTFLAHLAESELELSQEEHIERADRTPRDELDEEQLVKTVKPIIEEAGNILQECKGILRALDPDGQIAASAKARSVSHEVTSEEYQLADLLRQLSQTISTTIENGCRRIANML